MRLCGISSRFQLLSPCVRQVIHALLTRPPLSHRTIIPEGNQVKCFVRLACVKHAASVHPEPGSNSHVKKFSCPVINWLNQISIWFTVLRLFLYRNVRVLLFTTPWNSLNLSRLFHCSVIKVLCFVVVLGDSLFIISYQVCFVKNFFHFLKSFLSIGFVRSVILNATTLISYHVLFCLSRFFLFYFGNLFKIMLSSVKSCLIQRSAWL